MLDEDKSLNFHNYNYLLLSERTLQSKDSNLEKIGNLAENFEEFLFSQPKAVCSRGSLLLKLTEFIVNSGLVEAFEGPEDRDFGENDFPSQAQLAELSFEYLHSLLAQYETVETSCKRKFLVKVLMLCGTHHKKFMWSSQNSVSLCRDFLSTLLETTRHKSLSHLLTDDTFHPTIFKALLKSMRPSLLKDTWMRNPSSCHVFYWFLSHVKHPFLVDYLPDILPPSFMFTSYHSVPQILIGIKCFDHILDNVPPTSIKSDGTQEVIFDLLKKISQFNKDNELVEWIYPTLLKLPMVNSEKADQTKWLPYDIILQNLLENAEMEPDPKLKSIYLSHISSYISVIPCFKHLNKTLNVICNNLSVHSVTEECRISSLKAMIEVIKTCWPRLDHHFVYIMIALLKVMCDVESSNEGREVTQALNFCKECLQMLKCASPEAFVSMVREYIEGDNSLPGACFLKTLIGD